MMRLQVSRWIRAPLPSALIYVVGVCIGVALVAGVADPRARWGMAGALLALAVVLFVPIRGRLLIPEWLAVVTTFLRRRRRPLVLVCEAPVDVKVLSGIAGVRRDGHTLISAVELTAPPALHTETGSVATPAGAELPLTLVTSMMNQYGLVLDVDIVEAGSHVPPGTAYRTVYSHFVGPRPIIGQRRMWLVLRLDERRNLSQIVQRGPSRQAGPKALATATHRMVKRLQQERIRARALEAEGLEEMTSALLGAVEHAGGQERWSTLQVGSDLVTTYTGHPSMLAEGQRDRWWSWRTEETVTVMRLTTSDHNAVQISALVRYTDQGEARKPLPEAKLVCPTGVQRELFTATIPIGARSFAVETETVGLSAVREVQIPIGPTGQILGQLDDGTAVASSLWDQSASPHRRRVDARLGDELARQLVLRAVVTGAVVAIHTDNRARWDSLVATVADSNRLFYPTAGARTCDIAVFDGRPVTAAPARTVLRLTDPQAAPDDSFSPDLTLAEGPGGLQVQAVLAGQAPVTIEAIRTREEDRYLGLGRGVPAPPRRKVSTAPALSRAPRRQAPSPVAMPGGNGHREADRRRNLAAPQRVPRAQRRHTPEPSPSRPRRDYRPRRDDETPTGS